MKTASYKTARYTAFLLLVWPFVGCSQKTETPSSSPPSQRDNLDYVNLALNWFPEAEHGGYYAASVHGFYDEAGLHVTIHPGSPGAPVVQEVALGRVEFGIGNADQILIACSQEAPIKAIVAPMQNSPRCIMVHAAAGIKSFDDLREMTVALSDGKPFAMFLRQKYKFENVDFVPYPGNVSEFLLKPDFAQQAYVFSEPYVAEQNGGDPQTLMVSETGFNPYTSVAFTTNTMVETEPELVQRFVTASLKGWRKYLDDPTQTNAHIATLNGEMEPEILAFGATAMKSLCLPTPDSELGAMTLDRWQTLRTQLEDVEAMNQDDFSTSAAYTTDFLRKEESN